MSNKISKFLTRYGVSLVYLTGLSFVAIRATLNSRFSQSALLYVLIPFAISALLYFFTKPMEEKTVLAQYINHLRMSGIIFLITSAFLMEGFICVLFFLPIYFIMVTVGYALAAALNKGNKLKSVSLLLVVALLSVEGLFPQTTFPRKREAHYVTTTDLNVAELKANMAADITMKKQKDWFLRIFPLPDRIKAGTLNEGDVHNLHFTYKKWFFTNISKGEMDILISKVGEREIRTEIVKNTAYFSHYTNIKGTEVHFTPLDGGKTEISMTVKYERLLDPYWYFGPMQQVAAEQAARYLVDNIITREG